MKLQTLSAGALGLAMLLRPAMAADDNALTRMTLCQDSWVDWQKSDPAKLRAFAESFRAQFVPHGSDPFLLPKANVSVLGLRVIRAYPESVGMGVGFALSVDATFDDARKAVEKASASRSGNAKRATTCACAASTSRRSVPSRSRLRTRPARTTR